MKRLFVLLISICLVACLFAAPSKKYKLVVKTTNSEYSYALYKQPEISFTNTDMVIKMDQEDVRFAKSDIVEFLFDYNQYKVTFLDWDGDTLQSSMVAYGEYPSYNGATPERESYNQYSYTFSGWGLELDIVTEDVTYIAQYQELLRYEVAFYNWDGTLLQLNWYDYGEYPSYTGETPIREADTRYTYTFSGWNPQLDWVTGNQSYYAQYEATFNRYEVTFFNWDGSILQSSMVHYGEVPTYTGVTPTREADTQYTYTFTGWSPELDWVKGAANYYAQYEGTLNQYEINFYDWDGTLLQSEWVNYGAWPTYYNSDPWRESNAQYTYTFTGWSPQLDWVTGAANYYAQYEATLNQYQITFYDWNGIVLQSELVHYGEMPTYTGVTPTREADTQYTYTFSYWSPGLRMVTGNQSYYAQYEITFNQYEVTFFNWDGSVLQSSMVNYGEWPKYYNSDPWREADAQYTYTFSGWSPELDWVKGTASYYAQYETTLNQYEVTFFNWDGNVLQSTIVNYGEMPEYLDVTPTKPEDEQYIYTFLGWEPEITLVVDNAAYTAVYEAIEKVGSSIDDITTGTNKPRKVYIEGKLFIIIGDSVYSGQGHRIK